MSLTRSPHEEFVTIHSTLRNTFRLGKTRPLSWRRNQLYQLARMVQENFDVFAAALSRDLNKPKMEVLIGEALPVVQRCLLCASQLEEWAAPEPVDAPGLMKAWNPTINKIPKGVVIIIAPWNFPMTLSLQPLYGAISAGCTAVIKPSELAPNFANLLEELFPKYLDSSAYRVINGRTEETTKLLELRWDHILFTGSSRVGRIVATAAAKHLTPVTLELGGKSPVIVDPAYDIDITARRILSSKCANAGQICVSSDYVLVPRESQAKLVEALERAYREFYPNGALGSPDFARIINSQHHTRLTNLLEKTNGRIAFGGRSNDRLGLELTVVTDVKPDDVLMEDELFGPVLPIVPVDSLDEAINIINGKPHPLVLYVFTEDPAYKQKIIDTTHSGNLVFNVTISQLAVDNLPFGGIGDSGYGNQISKYSYDGLTHKRSTTDVPKEAQPFLDVTYPPYTEQKFQMVASQFFVDIPKVTK